MRVDVCAVTCVGVMEWVCAITCVGVREWMCVP